jgi:hypothetical protein
VAWGWLSPLVFPILSVIIAVWSLSDSPAERLPVRSSSLFWGTVLLSVIYLLMVWCVILLEPFSSLGWENIMKSSAWYLGLIQAVVAGAIAKFFIEQVH